MTMKRSRVGIRHILLSGMVLLAAIGSQSAVAQNRTSTTPDGSIVLNNWAQRWKDKLALVKKGGVGLLFMGDSITHFWDEPQNQSTFSSYFGGWHPLDVGISGARTETLLWMLQNGIVKGISPKVVVLLIGTNNADGVHFPHADSPWGIAGGVRAIVAELRRQLPNSKILLLNIFNRGDLKDAEQRVIATNKLLQGLGDDKHIFQLNLNAIWLDKQGHIDPKLMPDLLHPSPLGYLKWARALRPSLVKLMGEPGNNAIVPQPGVEHDIYNWQDRHKAELVYGATHHANLIFVGDSITHFWGGEPAANLSRGQLCWDYYYGDRKAINLGFGWDRTQQVLWRFDHGELKGQDPKAAVVLIGTNNLTPSVDRSNSNQEIIAGIHAVVEDLHQHCPHTHIILMGLLPRGEDPNDILRVRIQEINKKLSAYAAGWGVSYIDCGPLLLAPSGAFIAGTTVDYLHPTEEGYQLIANALEPLISKRLGVPAKPPMPGFFSRPLQSKPDKHL